MNPSSQHPSRARLVAFADGKLAGTEFSDVEQHMRQCGDCTATVEALFDEGTFLRDVKRAHGGATANGGESDSIETLVSLPYELISLVTSPSSKHMVAKVINLYFVEERYCNV